MSRDAQLSAPEILARPELWAAPGLPFLPASKTAASLALYLDALLAWNKKLNLVGCDACLPLMSGLVQDSFFLTRFLEDIFSQKNWQNPVTCDPGAGAGLPGVPLRLFWQKGRHVLIERRQKRALFLQNILARLKLPGVDLFAGDAAAFFANNPPCQCIVSRAFMPWQKLLAFCRPGLAPDGVIAVMANGPPPDNLPPGWRLLAKTAYNLAERPRWLWAIGQTQ